MISTITCQEDPVASVLLHLPDMIAQRVWHHMPSGLALEERHQGALENHIELWYPVPRKQE